MVTVVSVQSTGGATISTHQLALLSFIDTHNEDKTKTKTELLNTVHRLGFCRNWLDVANIVIMNISINHDGSITHLSPAI